MSEKRKPMLYDLSAIEGDRRAYGFVHFKEDGTQRGEFSISKKMVNGDVSRLEFTGGAVDIEDLIYALVFIRDNGA